MNNDINFRKIKSRDSSKNKGFEELCCQLASLEPPEEDAQWIRKEGAGGDEGVEAQLACPKKSSFFASSKEIFTILL